MRFVHLRDWSTECSPLAAISGQGGLVQQVSSQRVSVRLVLGLPVTFIHSVRASYRGTSLIRNSPPPQQDHHRDLGIVLLQGPREALLLMSEVPLYVGEKGVFVLDRNQHGHAFICVLPRRPGKTKGCVWVFGVRC